MGDLELTGPSNSFLRFNGHGLVFRRNHSLLALRYESDERQSTHSRMDQVSLSRSQNPPFSLAGPEERRGPHRYTAFYILYPVGAGSEAALIYFSAA